MKSLLAIAVIVFSYSQTRADAVIIRCGTPNSDNTYPVEFASESTHPSTDNLEYVALSYKTKDSVLESASAVTEKKHHPSGQEYDDVVGYKVVQKIVIQKKKKKKPQHFETEHFEFEFKDLSDCGKPDVGPIGSVVINAVGGFAGTRELETIVGCECNLD